MKQNLEVLISQVELSDDCEHLYLYTRNSEDSNCLWSQLAGQALDCTEGRQPILYNMPEDPPESHVLDIESDPDQLILLLQYLENDMKDHAFLQPGTTEHIRAQIKENTAKHASNIVLK